MLHCWNKFFGLKESALFQTQNTGELNKISAPKVLLFNQSMTEVGKQNTQVK